METIIQVKNLNNHSLFENLNLEVKKGTYLSIIGRNGCGKSTLIKSLLGMIPIDGEITINGVKLQSQGKKQIFKEIGVVFENINANFIAETPREDMISFLRNLEYTEKKIQKSIEEIAEKLNITEILDVTTSNLSGGEKQQVALALALIHKPSILILDDAFSMMDGIQKEKMFKILKKQNKEEKTTIIQVTHHMDDLLHSGEIAIIDKKKFILIGKKEEVLKQEKIFQHAGLELPFMASLSLKLQFYDLIDTTILDMDKMVNALWK